MISSMEVAYTAEANNIIEGFVQLRTAFHMWCADHPDSFDEIISATKIQNVPGFTSYMEKGNSFWNEVTSYIQKHSEPSNSENKHYYYKISSYKFWIGDGNEPIHVHVSKGKQTQSATKFWITQNGVELAHNNSHIEDDDLKKLLRYIRQNRFEIIGRWIERFGQGNVKR